MGNATTFSRQYSRQTTSADTCVNRLLMVKERIEISRKIKGNLWKPTWTTHSVQFSSVTQSCPTLCDPMNHSTPGLPVHHQLLELTQTHVHRVSDAIQPSHPWSSPSSPAPNPSQHQSLFQWVNYTFNKSQWNVCINSRVKFLPVLFFKDMWTGQLLLDSFKISMTEEESFYKQQPLQNTALTTVNRQSYRTTHYSGTESS